MFNSIIKFLLIIAFITIATIKGDDNDDSYEIILKKLLNFDKNYYNYTATEDEQNDPRIVGGREARPNEFPYQVAMNILMDNGNIQVCGGALVTNSWVITAAHCLYKAKSAEIILGAHDLTSSRELNQKRIIVHKKNFVIHSEFPKIWTDIAMLKLPIPISLTRAIQTVSLPCSKDNQRSFLGKSVLVSGWGMISDNPGSMAPRLKYTNIKIVSTDVCKNVFGSQLTANVAHIYCAKGGPLNTSTCSGDSGGPLVSLKKDGKIEKLIGVVSFGMVGGCTKGHPQGFVKISSYLKWISEKSAGEIRIPQC